MSDLKFYRKSFGDLTEGDYVLGSSGEPVMVLKAYEEHIPDSLYRVEFDDGSFVDASGNHLWYVVSSIDRSLHRRRIKEGRKLFKNLPEDSVSALLEMAAYDRVVEISLIDMLTVMCAENDSKKTDAVVRVANSIGYIAEENTQYQDLYGGQMVDAFSMRFYDAKIFSEQLLSLSFKKYSKKYPLLVGKVVSTIDLTMMLSMDLDIPELKKLDS